MKNLLIIIIFITSLFSLFSCMPEPLEIDIPEGEKKIVISSQFLKDSGVVVFCSRTFSALTDNYMPEKINIDFINKAFGLHSLVLMEYEGKTDTLYNMGIGMYYNASTVVNVGQNCHLTVYDSIIDKTVYADAAFLQNIDFDTVYVEIQIADDTSAIVYFRITDIPGENNYLVNHYIYEANQNSFDFSSILGTNPYADLLEQYIKDSGYGAALSRFTTIGNVDNKIKLFNDSNIPTTTFTDSVKFENISLNDTLAVSIANISKEYNDYLELRLKANTIYSQLMSDPINMPTNINDGYGMFTTHSLNIWLIDLYNNRILKNN